MDVEKSLDELWVGAKDLPNPVIAGSPRNSFRASLEMLRDGGRALDETRGLPGYRLQPNSEYRCANLGSQTAGDNLRGQKGNNPDRRLRSQNHAK